MDTHAQTFGLPVGYSDHTVGIEIAVAAVALGASIIEKHLTTDRTLLGPDHAASLDQVGFAALVRGIRTIEGALGSAEKQPAPVETDVRTVARRSLVTARDLYPGHEIGRHDLVALRPSEGIAPSETWDWEGRYPSRAYSAGELFGG
jgi:sialic acid synthase SpsE